MSIWPPCFQSQCPQNLCHGNNPPHILIDEVAMRRKTFSSPYILLADISNKLPAFTLISFPFSLPSSLTLIFPTSCRYLHLFVPLCLPSSSSQILPTSSQHFHLFFPLCLLSSSSQIFPTSCQHLCLSFPFVFPHLSCSYFNELLAFTLTSFPFCLPSSLI